VRFGFYNKTSCHIAQGIIVMSHMKTMTNLNVTTGLIVHWRSLILDPMGTGLNT